MTRAMLIAAACFVVPLALSLQQPVGLRRLGEIEDPLGVLVRGGGGTQLR